MLQPASLIKPHLSCLVLHTAGKKVESIGTDSSSDITVETAVTAKMIISVDQWGVIHAPRTSTCATYGARL